MELLSIRWPESWSPAWMTSILRRYSLAEAEALLTEDGRLRST